MDSMLGSFNLSKEYRVAYLRFLLNLLYDKYYITIAKMANGGGFTPTFIHDFRSGRKGIGTETADKLESYLNDLYGAIIEEEVPQDFKEFLKFANHLLEEENKKEY